MITIMWLVNTEAQIAEVLRLKREGWRELGVDTDQHGMKCWHLSRRRWFRTRYVQLIVVGYEPYTQ